jgi:pyruvate/2-oxoglutarate dehydrogenase complex dihydrolipoamide acyltransferase (E2) component
MISDADEPAPTEPHPEDVGENAAGSAEAGANSAEDGGGFAEDGDPAGDPGDSLSPSIRKLVRQYGVDVTSIRGSGPHGRLRIGDVMAALGGGSELEPCERPPDDPATGAGEAASCLAGNRRALDADTMSDSSAAAPASFDFEADAPDCFALGAEALDPLAFGSDSRRSPGSPARDSLEQHVAAPSTTVFECDLGSVSLHRLRRRQHGLDLSPLCYFIVACARALDVVPEANGTRAPPQIGVETSIAGDARTLLIRNTRDLTVEAVAGELAELRAAQGAARAGAARDVAEAAAAGERHDVAHEREAAARERQDATLWINDYGASGSVLALPAPLLEGHVASVGIGRPRRGIVVRRVDGEEVLRAATLCYVALTFRPDTLPLARANAYLGEVVRILEAWPKP